MCEGEYCVVCFVGYGLPIGCCLAGGAMTCYGCYRYYFLTNQRRMQDVQQQHDRRQRGVVTQQPVKADTLKRKMLNKFLATMDKIHGIETTDTTELNTCTSAEEDTSDSGKITPLPNDACPICFDEYDGDPSAIFMGVVKSCQHYFHFECLWEWLELNSSCPLCRTTARLTETDIIGTSFTEVQKLIPDKQVNEVRCHLSREASLAQISGIVASLPTVQIAGMGDSSSSSSTSRHSELQASGSAAQISGLAPSSSTAQLTRLAALSSGPQTSAADQHETGSVSNNAQSSSSSRQNSKRAVSSTHITGLHDDTAATNPRAPGVESVATGADGQSAPEAPSDRATAHENSPVHWDIGSGEADATTPPPTHAAKDNANEEDLGVEEAESAAKSAVSAPCKVHCDLQSEPPEVVPIDRGHQNAAYVADL